MTRTVPPDRLAQLVDCATRVFIEQGYRRTQMADVAEALGVAKGTVYLYVESKEALFDLVLRHADAEHPPAAPAALPIPTPRPGSTLRLVRERVGEEVTVPALSAALQRRRAGDVRAELGAIVRELYDAANQQRTAIKLIDRCAHDYPDLAAVWYAAGRETQLRLLTAYLERRIAAAQLRPVPDLGVAARFIIETIVVWAVHRYWDPAPQPVSDDAARDTVVQLIVNAFAPAPARPSRRTRPRG